MTIEARFSITRGEFTFDADLSVPARGVTALYGPSGCGKTSLLRAMAGLDHHAGGYLKLGDTVWQQGAHFVAPHRRAIGYVFQEPSLFDHLSVQRNLDYGLKRVPANERRISLQQAIELLGIGSLLARQPGTLSGGERQRVAIARALAVSPELLLMDEPLASLDLARKREILPYIESLHRELDIPVIYVSHVPNEVARLTDHLVLLGDGKVVATGDIQGMLTRLDLPLAHDRDAAAVIEATVAGHDEEFDLTYLDFAGGRITVTQRSLPVGSAVRVRIAARDVSLTLQRQSDTSILNIFAAIIEEVCDEGRAQVSVRMTAGGVPLLARVTRKSAGALALEQGKRVFAQAKSVALL